MEREGGKLGSGKDARAVTWCDMGWGDEVNSSAREARHEGIFQDDICEQDGDWVILGYTDVCQLIW